MRSGPEMRAAWYFTCAPTSMTMRVYVSVFHVRILVTCGRELAVAWSSPEAAGFVSVAAGVFPAMATFAGGRSFALEILGAGLSAALAARNFVRMARTSSAWDERGWSAKNCS